MTVKELIKTLQEEDPDRIVIVQKDSEGNGYSPLYSIWTGSYMKENTYSGHVGLEKLNDDDIKSGYTEEDLVDGSPALILCPTN